MVPTLYKAPGVPTEQPVCAICADRTRGTTEVVRLGHGVAVWLCASHASVEFQTRRSGRDFVLTLERLWRAHGCLTASRRRALDAHLRALAGPAPRARPGSYAWPDLRREAERRFARGDPPEPTIATLLAGHAGGGVRLPTSRTMLRWHAERRWVAQAPE
jgi:hypothetical protein